MANWREMEEANVLRQFEEFYGQKNIEEQCSEEDLMNLHEAFLVAEGEVMSESQLQEGFRNILKIHIPDEEFSVLFAKINLKRDGYTTWDEFITYLILEFQQRDNTHQRQTLELPITGEIEVQRTHHRNTVCRITFCPEVRSDRTWDFLQGCYVTVSRDGVINYWSLDLEYERSVHSTNPHLRVCPTIITDMIVLPDIQIVCTSSSERDLRFYDTVAKKFDLRVMISSLENAVVCMSYYFSPNIKENSYIILGDMGGTVKVLSFSPLEKGPFKHDPRHDLIHLRYEAVARGELQGMKVTEFKNIHSDWVRQVGYYSKLRAFISCGICSDHSVFLSDATGTRMQYVFNVAKGISCFDFSEGHILVTGGPDCVIRVWNPFVPHKPNCIFQGHHAAISALVIQNAGKRIYSLSKDKCLKVWDVAARACIQTYNGLPSELGEHTPISVIYNSITRKLIIASMKIVILTCEHVINEEISDGQTHAKPVSCVLYNRLFKVVVTAGLDSCIIVWNPWLGNHLYLRRNAHHNIVYGEKVPVEITAASFDTSEHLLLTGARDGTIKMWNFNSGTCIRNMNIEAQCEITSIIWLSNRILCTGWNRHITEFADTETGVHTKSWETRHTDDILCTAVSPAQTLATASYNGELILWRLETGQPYRRYRVNNPTGRYAIPYKKEAKDKGESPAMKNLKINPTAGTSNSISESDISLPCTTAHDAGFSEPHKSALSFTRTVGVYAMIFLNTRLMAPDVGSLLLSLENGMIQVWTHHPAAGFLTSFSAIHTLGDYAMSLATDPKNKYLITGHTAGYIKVWLLSNYVVPHPPDLCIARLKLKFPFLWKDRIDGRAKRAVRNQLLPLLLSSVRAHCKTINALQYIPEVKLILSGSSDHTVRLWTLSGRYISTLGTFRPWSTLLPNTSVQKYFSSYRLPPDIKRVGSFTTMKVLNGGQIQEKLEGKTDETEMLKEVPEHERYMLYGRRLSSPKLGHYYKLPVRSNAYGAQPVLDSSLAYIPVYTHLVTHDLEPIKTPPVPQLIQKSIPVLHSKMRTKGVQSPTKETQRNSHTKTEKSTEAEDSSQTNRSRSSH